MIAWSTPEESPGLAGDVDGVGGSAYAYTTGRPYVLVAGQVELDAPDLAEVLQWPEDPATRVPSSCMNSPMWWDLTMWMIRPS